jgi:hypothetical protein
LNDEEGEHLTGTIGLILSIYREPEGGSPLWQEVQNLEADKLGDFSIVAGSGTIDEVAAEIRATKKPLWLGQTVLLPGQSERRRIPLSSTANGLKVPRVIRLVIPKSSGLQRTIPEAPEAMEDSFFSSAGSTGNGQPSESSASRTGDASDTAPPRKWANRRAKPR